MFLVQASFTKETNRTLVARDGNRESAATLAESFFVNNPHYEVRVLHGPSGRLATDKDGREYLWRKN